MDMNLMFSDIGSSFLSMTQQNIPKEILLNADNFSSQKQVFANHLNQQIEKTDTQKDSSFSAAISGAFQAGQNSASGIPGLLAKLQQEDGPGFVSALKEILLKLSKGDLKNFTIDASGLEALKKMLLTAGFKEADVNDLFADFLEKTTTGKLTLAELMGKLSDFSLEKKPGEDQPENFLEISALPFLESILNSLGLKPEEIQKIMTGADKGEKGLSLDVIIEKLKSLQKNSFYAQKTFETIEGDDNYQHLLKQLGMEQAEETSASLSLNEFVDALEKLRKKLSQDASAKGTGIFDPETQAAASEKTPDLFNALFKGLEQLKPTEKATGFGFSYDGIKNQFENKLLLPDEKNTAGNTIFSVSKDVMQGAETKQKEVNKNLEIILNQKKNNDADPGNFQKETRSLLKQIKPESSKFIDSLQVPGTESKTQELQSGTSVLRAKPSLNDLPSYVTHQVSKSLVRAINQGENILRIQLKPPELGRLMMTIDNTGSTMKVSIMTDNQAAKEILVSNINDIRAALSNSGVTLDRFDVDMSSNFQQSMADARNQAGNSDKRKQNREKIQTDLLAGAGLDDPAGLLNTVNPDGSLHYVA